MSIAVLRVRWTVTLVPGLHSDHRMTGFSEGREISESDIKPGQPPRLMAE